MSEPLLFHSTRGAGSATLEQAISAGLAPDGGLYVPEALPRLSIDAFADAGTLAEVAAVLLQPFFAGSSLAGALPAICAESLSFDTPLKPLGQRANAYVLELFHGPTAAFKDVGARFLAACLARQLRGESSQPLLTILVATSGDTGAAVAAALHQQPGIQVVILYPDGRVSPRQAHQLGCFGDNVQALRVDGTFDDCQRMVKAMLGDTELQAQRPLSSANSISLGRLLPQMSYYAQASLAIWRTHGTEANFIVPTGNLGNAIACVYARAGGLPVGDIVLATNANRVLPDFFAGGAYAPRPSVATLANAMDVGTPSNFERLRWIYSDDAALRKALEADSVDDDAIRNEIRTSESRYGTLVCPHTATATAVLGRLRARGDRRDFAVVATAHPAKFEEVIEPLIGRRIEVPPALATLLARPSRSEPIAANYTALRERLIALAR